MSEIACESRSAYHELMELLRELDTRFLGPEWGLGSGEDVAEALRALMHVIEGGLVTHFESDPDHPRFQRIVSPSRKLTGDNPDAIYYDAPVRAGRAYRIRGDVTGAIYTSLTVEAGAADGRMGTGTAGVLNDTQFDCAVDGTFEIVVGGAERDRNWLPLPPDAMRITTRHYYEQPTPAAGDPTLEIPLTIDVLGEPAPPPVTNDATIAAGIRRVTNFVRSRTLEMGAPGSRQPPSFVSTTPNEFPAPVRPGDFALAATDAAYSMAPYVLGPEDALVVRARWPECRCANVCLWNRHMQTYDYVNRSVSLNRAQTSLQPDGSFDVVIAARDPGVPNWLDTEGRPFGMVFWRYMLPEGAIAQPDARVVAIADLTR